MENIATEAMIENGVAAGDNIPSFHLINQDAFIGLPTLASDSFDLCIVDPPYGASSKHNWSYCKKENLKGFGGDWNLENEAWDLLTKNDSFLNTFFWLKELKRIIKLEGSIWIHSTYHNSGFVNVCCQLLGLEIINEIVWFKRNSFPNLSGRRLTASHETILWVHKGGEKNRKYYFNYPASKFFYSPSDNIKVAGKQMRTVWDIPNNKSKVELKYGTHPTQKPIKVSERILALCGVKNGNLLVPFAGSGTEMVSGIKFGMNVTGFEIDKKYFSIAKNRLVDAQNDMRNSLFV